MIELERRKARRMGGKRGGGATRRDRDGGT